MNRNIFANFGRHDANAPDTIVMDKVNILWADDEIDLLKPHLLFLKEKGYDVTTVTNGNDAITEFGKQPFDVVFLDENMPGLSGIETLSRIKNINADIPIIMITKSEAEEIMEEAIGSKISDYLIKPVNPHQILLALKKNLENKRLVSEKTNTAYQRQFQQISMDLSDKLNWNQWKDVYRKLVYWELELEKATDQGMYEILISQKNEANNLFSKFIENNYIKWLKAADDSIPVMSNTLMKKKILPAVDAADEPLFLILIDNLRYDQWKIIQPVISEYFRLQEEDLYMSILPTATQYSRNSIFAGLMPSEMEQRFPDLWKNDEEEGGKNLHEGDFLEDLLHRFKKEYKHSYTKITNNADGKKLTDGIHQMMQNKLNVIVYNFVDMLSHARTDVEMIRELVDDEAAYRSITLSWLEHSPLLDALKLIAEMKGRIIITTDHGTIRVKDPVKIVGDKNVNTNLRYKNGKTLNYNRNEVFEVKNPADAMLPKQHVSQAFVFTRNNDFFAYPNNYNYYVSYYRNTLQHGGISMEEMIIPFAVLTAK